MNRAHRLACLASAILLGACSSPPTTPPPVTDLPLAPSVPAPAAPPAAPPAPAAVPTPVAPRTLPPYLDPANRLSSERSLYFDFDQFTVKPEGQRLLELHGQYLAAHPAVTIRVEGNADEQGSAEYNLALGQKRAQAVVNILRVQGVAERQMEAISFGKEKPRALGHDEAAHAENRRVDLAYPPN